MTSNKKTRLIYAHVSHTKNLIYIGFIYRKQKLI